MSAIAFKYSGLFEDNHGIVHTDPVFALSYYNKRTDDTISGRLQKGESGHEFNESANAHKNFDYSVQFWTNQTAYDSGKDSIQFSKDGLSHFSFQLETNPSTHASIRAACQDHFLTTILPDLLVTA